MANRAGKIWKLSVKQIRNGIDKNEMIMYNGHVKNEGGMTQ